MFLFLLFATNMFQSLVPATDPSVVDVGAIFEDCVNQVANTDGTNAAAITAEFLNKMLGPNTKVLERLLIIRSNKLNFESESLYY